MDQEKPLILIVEDEKLLLQAIARKLKTDNFSTITTESGLEAINILKNTTRLPNAIWLDYYLKDINGIEFMQELNNNNDWKQIPVIVVSNSANPIKVNAMIKLGVHKYFLKAEHRLDDIIMTLKSIVNNHKTNNQSVSQMNDQKKILIVDDEVNVVKALKPKLQEENFLVEVASDGMEALEKVKQIKPDLILLDIIMPKLDGISTLKKIKESPDTQTIPVIILTNLYDDKKIHECLRENNTEYLIKVDHTIDDIVNMVKTKLNNTA